MESKKGADQSRRNKMVKKEKEKKKKQHQLVEKDEMPNEVEEKSSVSTVMQKKRRRAEEKDAVKMSREDKKLEAKTEKKKGKSSRKKKRKSEEKNDDAFQEDNAGQDQSETLGKIESSKEAGKVKKSGKKGKKSLEKRQGPHTDMSLGKDEEAEADDVYLIPSGDDDCSKGMKKWVVEYHQSRPGLKILQERIDEFITSHEAQLEQERKEREARAAEGGWTVVVHHKGRKKTTDSESGITVGSVAQAVVEDKLTKKKNKEVGLDFYRFQKREAQRNEIMMLQSKFEQDKKRIQQLRAARKFRPY